MPIICPWPMMPESQAGNPPACPAEDRRERFVLLLAGTRVEEQAHLEILCLACPEVTFERDEGIIRRSTPLL